MRFLTVYVLLIAISLPTIAHASAWLQPKGKSQLFSTSYYYRSHEYADPAGYLWPQQRFTKWEQVFQWEYGLRHDITYGIAPRLGYALQNGSGSVGDLAFTGLELFRRQKLWQGQNSILSTQTSVIMPGIYNDTQTALLGKRSTDYDMRILLGHSMPDNGLYHYINAELGYRLRSGDVGDEIRAELTSGYRLSEQWTLLQQLFLTLSAAGTQEDMPSLVAVSPADYNLAKYQLSAVYDVNENRSIQLGVTQDLWSQNTGQGTGVLFSVWYRF